LIAVCNARANRANWEDHAFVDRLIDQLLSEINRRWEYPADDFSSFGASVVNDLTTIEKQVHSESAFLAIAFVRFLVAAAAVRHAVQHGRPSIVYNWILCSLSDRPHEDVETGTPVEIDYWPDRPIRFLTSTYASVRESAPLAVVRWFGDVFYAGWKYSLHHNLAQAVLPHARRCISTAIESGEDDLVSDAIVAAAQLACWLNQTGDREAVAIAGVLARAFDQPTSPPEARKTAGMALASQVGYHTTEGPTHWAGRVLTECRGQLAPHEVVHMLAASCATPQEIVDRSGELLAAIEESARRTAIDCGGDVPGIEFRHTQLFETISPTIRELLSIGRCKEAVEMVAAWFGVPADLRRRSPVLGVAPTHEKGAFYAVDGQSILIDRDTDAAMRRMTAAINHAFDLTIVLRTERDLPPTTKGRRGSRTGPVDELAAATADYYALDSLAEFLSTAPVTPTAVFQPYAELTPFQALSQAVLGKCLPLLTSFEEPKADRPIRRALIWSCGTILGGFEARSVAAFFSARGVDCVSLIEEGLTRKRFIELYADDIFDLLYLTGHGTYDAREPHRACIELSEDKEHRASVADMLRHPVRGEGRRLLLLNICLGGTVLVTAAPARLGMGAMLAGANQAVIGHMAEVSNFVAPLFGVLMALGLQQTGAFFPAFSFALGTLPGDHAATMQMLRDQAPECQEIVDRLSRSRSGVDPDDIRTWGTPVFYE